MQKRSMRSVLWVAALVFGLAAGTTVARARESSPAAKDDVADQEPRKDTKTGKAKVGEACKSNNDCDQSGTAKACRENKCRVVIRPVVT